MELTTDRLLRCVSAVPEEATARSRDPWLAALSRARSPLHEKWLRPVFQGVSRGLAGLAGDATLRKFSDRSWDELLDTAADQIIKNGWLKEEPGDTARDASCPGLKGGAPPLARRYAQLPCTTSTLQRRLERIRPLAQPHEPVLILGDDDLFSLEMARHGYTDITVLEIDPMVIDQIRGRATHEGLRITLHRQDLSASLPDSLARPYRLVTMDPVYTPEGVRFFLSAALKLVRESPAPAFFLSLHPLSLGQRGIEDLEAWLGKRGLEIAEAYPALNAYPVPGYWRTFLSLISRFLTRKGPGKTRATPPRFFVSDAFVIRPAGS